MVERDDELLAHPGAHALLEAAAREAAAVAAAQGVRLPYPDAVAAVEEVARRTSENYSSMLRDVQRGAPTEIDAINGAIVRAGERAGVPTPINHALWQLVKEIEARPDGRRLPAERRLEGRKMGDWALGQIDRMPVREHGHRQHAR